MYKRQALPDFDLKGMFSGIVDMFSIDGILGNIGRKIEAADFGKWTPDWVKNALLKVFDPTKGMQAAANSMSSHPMGSRATGGPFAANAPIIVGELGPEIILPSFGGQVLNAERTAQIQEAGLRRGAGGAGGTTTIPIVSAPVTSVNNSSMTNTTTSFSHPSSILKTVNVAA